MLYRNFKLDKFQKNAIASINAHHTVLVAAPTGAGKTLIAEYAIEKCLNEDRRAIYTGPIKTLSNQKYRDFKAKFGDDKVGILTGDVVINPGAPIRIMTTEIFRNSIFEDQAGLDGVDYVVLDEIHYIDNEERGTVWEESIIFTPQDINFICLSATMPNLTELADWMKTVRHNQIDVVSESERPVPLHHEIYTEDFGTGSLEDLVALRKKSPTAGGFMPEEWAKAVDKIYESDLIDLIIERKQLPCLYFSSSRKQCEDRAFDYSDKNLLTDEENNNVLRFYDEICIQYNMGDNKSALFMRDLVARGVAYHHAGMLPTMKDIIEQIFTSGLLKLLFTTETFAVGVNMPACTVVFDGLEKYDGIRMRPLKSREYQQMAGRAGRRGIDKQGFVYMRIDPEEVDNDLAKRILTGGSEPIESRFNLGYSSILNLYSHHGENIFEVCEKSYGRFQASERLERLQNQIEEAKIRASETMKCIKDDIKSIGEYERISQEVKSRRWALKRQIKRIRDENRGDKRLRDQRTGQAIADFQRFESQLKKTVCYNCPDLNECLQKDRRIVTSRRTYENLTEEVSRIESYHPEQVKRRLNFLKSLGYIDNGRLSSKGRVAAWVYGYELQTTEMLFGGFFDLMDEDQINILAAAIIFESRETDWYRPAPQSLLSDVFYRADKYLQQLKQREKLFGIKGIQIKSLDASLTSAIYAWSKEKCEFDDLVKYTNSAEGDLVRSFRMSIDLLRQIQRAIAGNNQILEKLELSIKKINRGVVDAERQLRGRLMG
jgi:superfamily II RNA helicase